jgi:cytochrome c553
VPNLAGESPLYLEKQLNAFRSGERKHEQMSIIAQSLQDNDISDLAAWYSKLKVTVEVPQQ